MPLLSWIVRSIETNEKLKPVNSSTNLYEFFLHLDLRYDYSTNVKTNVTADK